MRPGGGEARHKGPMTPMESERTENKSSLAEWREVVESVAAFATSGGGQVRIGIGPDGRRIGVRLGRGTLEDLANKIKVNTDPAQFPWGTGTLRMIQATKDRGMRLEFGEDGGVFLARFVGAARVVSRPADVPISARQEKALRYLAEHGTITRREYRNLFHVSERQSSRDLTEMMEKGMVIRLGRGHTTRYQLPTARLVRD